ncbi:MAG TPA: LysM peptidoglycan-binding domain-containing protein [Anaerolineaceae bacterium]|nr:LysM peptidoglycan-binding domain-containing protein [Anaerolineaceae bacterium]
MKKSIYLVLLTVLILSGCADNGQRTSELELTPYGVTPTPSAQSGTVAETPTPFPTPSPAPQYHTVQAGETMSSIALLYGLDMNDVVLANPEIDPNTMVVGMQVLIPPKTADVEITNYSSTPAPIVLSRPTCEQEKSGGVWCFLTAENQNEFAVENVLVEITLGDENAAQLTAQVAAAPLNLLPSGEKLPLSAYFPPPVPQPYRFSFLLKSAIAVEDESRYLSTELLEQSITISQDGLSAQISARIFVNGIAGRNVRVWLALTALDDENTIVGVRRLETKGTLGETGVMVVSGNVYSTGALIRTVELKAEAMYSQ